MVVDFDTVMEVDWKFRLLGKIAMRPARINTVNILTLLSAPGVGRRTVQQILSDTTTMASSRPEELRELLLERAKNACPHRSRNGEGI